MRNSLSLRQLIKEIVADEKQKYFINHDETFKDKSVKPAEEMVRKALKATGAVAIPRNWDHEFALGFGAFGIVIEVLWRGKRCAMKLTQDEPDFQRYEKISKLRQHVPNFIRRHLPLIYLTQQLPGETEDESIYVTIMEILQPLPTGLSLEGWHETGYHGAKDVEFVVKTSITKISKHLPRIVERALRKNSPSASLAEWFWNEISNRIDSIGNKHLLFDLFWGTNTTGNLQLITDFIVRKIKALLLLAGDRLYERWGGGEDEDDDEGDNNETGSRNDSHNDSRSDAHSTSKKDKKYRLSLLRKFDRKGSIDAVLADVRAALNEILGIGYTGRRRKRTIDKLYPGRSNAAAYESDRAGTQDYEDPRLRKLSVALQWLTDHHLAFHDDMYATNVLYRPSTNDLVAVDVGEWEFPS